MLKEFNLVVSTYRGRENDCISELWYFLRELGDPRVEASKTGLPGLIVAKTSLNASTMTGMVSASVPSRSNANSR